MLDNKLICSNLRGRFIAKRATMTTPQGVLSLLLWFLVADVDLRRLKSRGFKVVTYTSDVVVLLGDNFLSTLAGVYN